MTDGVKDDQSSECEGVPPSRKVAKTMLESDSPDLKKIRQLLTPEQNKPVKRISKTLLDVGRSSAGDDVNAQAVPINSTEGGGGKQADSGIRKVAKTKLDTKMPKVAKTQLELQSPLNKIEGPRGAAKSPSMKFVAKTKLDLSMLSETILKYETRKEARVAEEAAERAKHPLEVIEPLVAKRSIKFCPYTWNKGKDRVGNCSNCNSSIYNFDGLDLKSAEALIFKRENKSSFTLLKRADGKFMTEDCPVRVRNRNTKIAVTVFGTILLVALSAVLAFIHTSQMSGSSVTGSESSSSTPSSETSTAPAALDSRADADIFKDHYVNGKRQRPTFNADDESKYWD